MYTQAPRPQISNGSSMLGHDAIYAGVQDCYGSAAKGADNAYGHAVASAFGYSKDELANVPAESNLGLSCGNPFVVANLRQGEQVIDLGSGAGFDVFQAAQKVGDTGKVFGVDMNDEMLARANNIKQKTNAHNVWFVKCRITSIELPNSTADCIISNCVINLVPEIEKPLVFKEMFRLLKPNGRVAISDILIKKDLPESLKNDMALYVGCIAGASRVEGYERYLKEAGFKEILIVADLSDLNVYKSAGETGVGCCGPASAKKSTCCSGNVTPQNSDGVNDIDFNEWAASYKIYAIKA